MHSNGPALKELSKDECLQLMASVPIGRIIFTRQALPAVELVNFALDHGDIVIRTDRSGKLAAATREAVVAFEADCMDTAGRSGWSVTAIGQCREVTDPEERRGLLRMGLNSWAPGERAHFIRISPGILNGRRLDAQGLQIPAEQVQVQDLRPGPRSPELMTRSPTGISRSSRRLTPWHRGTIRSC
jgi:nitroimidazol reductase NimA-like FMN-containing flavoprotein (pyridoxamine 5'-phosphate oxidase superfamily)